MLTPYHDRVLRAYLHAKDCGVPARFADAFTPDATFTSRFEFETSFSDEEPRVGLAAIAETFGLLTKHCDNITTLCTLDSVVTDGDTLRNKWIVAMTNRDSGCIRVAWGDYVWTMDPEAERARSLIVNMRHMAEMGPEHAEVVLVWLRALPAPWCDGQALVVDMPALLGLVNLREYFV